MKNDSLFTQLEVILVIAILSLWACSNEERTGKDNIEPQEEHEHQESKGHGHDKTEHGHEEKQSTMVSHEISQEVGLKTASVGEQTLHQTIVSYGEITTGTDQLSHVRARFPGQVKSVNANIGDEVKQGDLLAKIESNDSLLIYQIYSPISGVVTQRHANTGEYTADQVLFSIANFDRLWAEFRLYPEQVALVEKGQLVTFNAGKQQIIASVKHVVPVVDKPYQLARLEFDNTERGMAPGIIVEGHIQVAEYNVPQAVTRNAIQNMAGREGVFVKVREEYHFSPVVLGRRDDHYVEVVSGIVAGQEYVTENSYLIKADMEKSEAEHAH